MGNIRRRTALLAAGFLGVPQFASHTCAAESPKSAPGNETQQSRHPRYETDCQRRTFKGSSDAGLSYGWLTPLKANAGEKYPLVICLHGAGGSVKASAVLARQPMREQQPAFVMVPEGDRLFTWAKTDIIRRGGRAEFPEKLSDGHLHLKNALT